MAERKSTRAINVRKKALEAAKAFQEREERLLALAEDFSSWKNRVVWQQ